MKLNNTRKESYKKDFFLVLCAQHRHNLKIVYNPTPLYK